MQLTARYPFPYSGDIERTVRDLQDWAVGLLDSLKPTLNNLDAGNVLEAASVRAENINTRHAKIKDAQIQDLTADKITAGTIDAQVIDVINIIADRIKTGTLTVTKDMLITNENGTVEIDSETLTIYDNKKRPRIQMGKGSDNKYLFVMYGLDKNGDTEPSICLNDKGNAIFTGTVQASEIQSSTMNSSTINASEIQSSTINASEINSTDIYSCHIVGTDKKTYEKHKNPNSEYAIGVFAELSEKGFKIMKDDGGERSQKVGLTVDTSGEPILMLGAGNGDNRNVVNGVQYGDDMLMIKKGVKTTELALLGTKSNISFSQNQTTINGKNIFLNGINLLEKVNTLENKIHTLNAAISTLEGEIDKLKNQGTTL